MSREELTVGRTVTANSRTRPGVDDEMIGHHNRHTPPFRTADFVEEMVLSRQQKMKEN